MTGTIIRLFQGGPDAPAYYNFWGGVILADGTFYDYADPRWIGSPAPRDGQYVFEGYQVQPNPPFYVGQRVSFTPNPGHDYQPGFETASTATNVTAI